MSSDLSARPAAISRLIGVPASPGVRRGTAVAVTASTRCEDLCDAPVLIVDGTATEWLPLLQHASALVLTGGVLSTPATLAREMRIPAVVVDQQAVARIPISALVLVDGGSGTIDFL